MNYVPVVSGFSGITTLTSETVVIPPSASTILVWRIRRTCNTGEKKIIIHFIELTHARTHARTLFTSITHHRRSGLPKSQQALRTLRVEGRTTRRHHTCRDREREILIKLIMEYDGLFDVSVRV